MTRTNSPRQVERVRSLSCIRARISKTEFAGCGRGWEEPYSDKPPVCDRCGRPARVTGIYMKIPIGGYSG